MRFAILLPVCLAATVTAAKPPVDEPSTSRPSATSSATPSATDSAPLSGSSLAESSFADTVRPFVQTYCADCHNGDTSEGDLDLVADENAAAVTENFRRWNVVLQRLVDGDMPPEDAGPQPSDDERKQIIEWITKVKKAEAHRTDGDPGIVLARRLNNAEFDHSIADLTGVDIRPAAEFPIDPANEAGFDNSGDSLTMSPVLLKKYLAANRHVSDHLVLTPSGITFAPHPVMTDTDRDKFCVNRIVDFYRQQCTDYAKYFETLWKSKQESEDAAARSGRAKDAGLSQRYTETLWQLLHSPAEPVGPIAALQSIWNELPDGSSPDDQAKAAADCQQMATLVTTLREALVPEVPNLTSPQMNPGSQPLVLWKNRQFVANRRRYAGGGLPDGDFGLTPDSPASRLMKRESADAPDPTAENSASETSASENADEASPAPTAMDRALERFCDVFPDTFFVSERARTYLDPAVEAKQGRSGRLLSAGFHSQMGYFRDDAPLYDLMLSESQQQELDRLWLELDFVASAPMRQYSGFIWFDRTDSQFMRDRVFDRYRAEDKSNSDESKVRGLEEAYTSKAKRVGGSDESVAAIHRYFDDMSKTFRRLERLRAQSEPKQIEAVVQLAERAFRRPLTPQQQTDIVDFYQSLRQDDGLTHEEAIRDSVVRILMSPQFCYRVSPAASSGSDDGSAAPEIQPLDGYAIANRLSYFLWASMPDAELMQLAESGRLVDRDVLIDQTDRMLQDARVQRFVVQFVGNWLDFRQFEQHNGVDRGRFPAFTDQLRQSMHDEPIRFVEDVIQRDGSILDFLYADHTFVDTELAKHYGMPATDIDGDQWKRVDDAGSFQRGGLLPMAVFLTNQSPGLRTSPVKRGNWVVKRILGEHVPAPPATVPELPEDESKLGELTLREALAKHREHPSCASCHEKIDSFGLVFENYGPVGEWRDTDLGGRAVDSSVVFPDASEGIGLVGLRQYIRSEREDDFIDNLCRKLLAYGLGRTVQLSDEQLVERMKSNLASQDYRFGSMIETIVTSPAFLNQRVRHADDEL
ncbi:hypothetical protein K227x_02970 [Rubripirellula lacrimiformis]|uniref:Planctomycete cytochrome C n=1 Tax=Rubripirellula lacrimiformis TaxID=1930273 RepID=A0A517N4J3_9BACT|nr:DUF1592 domain-containing protein [Rubripirellula lacrimiformis]QDT01928.1 hypothetical protein K227x_02970 [Rubripirellula lacrimiformis]